MLATGAEPDLSLVPRPKQVQWSAQQALLLETGRVAIVLGDRAVEPERQAARLLQVRVAQRLGQDWPVVTESAVAASARVLILLGQRSTHAMLDRLCTTQDVRLSSDSPGHDGYVIDFARDGAREIVLVGASNARAVIYGQDTLFQMLRAATSGVSLRRAVIRDWPTVPWRGRPQTHYRYYLDPGAMDCYMTSRINWIDLRDGIYAFEPDSKLDREVLGRVIAEAHARDLLVYGAVNCGVPADHRPAVLERFAEFIEMGADGLVLSFDDKGPGEDPVAMVTETLKLARAHGITGRRISMCPPKGSYQEIDTEFNRKILAIAGMEEAMVLWTRVPCEEDVRTAARVGVEGKPSWWHNWTRPASGLTHIESNSLHAGGRKSYMQVPTMAAGWHAPGYDQLSRGGACCESVMPWGGQGWGQYYIVPVIGWWAWSPEAHDFEATRERIYDIVYGPGQVQAARRLDDLLAQVKRLFVYPVDSSDWLPLCPPRLGRLEDRSQAVNLLSELERIAASLADSGCAGSLVPKDLLDEWYLSAMRDEVAVGKAEATASFPEYWWNAHQREVLTAVYDGDLARANAAIHGVRPRLLADLQAIERELAGLRTTPEYLAWWRRQATMDAAAWRERIDVRRQELTARVDWYAYAVATLANLLGAADSPPLGQGTGRWERQNFVLATVLPEDREQYWGNWMGGIYRGGGREAAVFAFRHRTEGAVGAFCELPVTIPLSGDRSRLGLMIYLSNVDKDSIGLHHVPRRWSGHRRIALLQENRAVWEADLGLPRPRGEWTLVRLHDIPPEARELKLALRVEDLKETRAHAIAFVGPIHLVQLPE